MTIPGRATIFPVALEILLITFLVIRGLIPAFSAIDTDFPNYYTAGKIVLGGEDVDKMYDDAWFQGRINDQGIHQQGKFSPFPPATALLCVPLALLPPLSAIRVLTMINLLALVISSLALSRVAQIPFNTSRIITLLSGVGLANCFRFGQLYVLLSCCMILGFYLRSIGRPIAAGVLWGIWIPVKYFPVVLLLYCIARKEWHVVIAAFAATAVVAGVSLLVLGWEIHRQFLTIVLGGHLHGELTLQSPFTPVFQSFSSLYHSLFLQDPVLHPHAVFPSTVAFQAASWLTLGLIVGLLAVALLRIRHGSPSEGATLSLLTIGTLLAAPVTATYHMVLLWLGGGLFWRDLKEGQSDVARIAFAVLYAVLGFLPYSDFLNFYDKGALLFLAYPRLIVLTAIFTGLLVWTSRRMSEKTPGSELTPSQG